MQKFSVIDIGSNSVRLLFVADGKILYKALQTTRLGEGLVRAPYLLDEPIARTANAVAAFYAQARAEGADEVFAFATAAVRSANNRACFLERVRALCGLEIDVLSGEEEAEIGLLGALGKADGGVLDIGGASTELVVKEGEKIVYKKSVDVGVVRLKERCGGALSALQDFSAQAAKAFSDFPKGAPVCAIGGTATTVAAQLLGLEEYSSARVTGAKITRENLWALTEKFARMTVEEIGALPCMPQGRADVVFGGAVWLYTLMQSLEMEEITVSDRDNLEGYAVKKGKL